MVEWHLEGSVKGNPKTYLLTIVAFLAPVKIGNAQWIQTNGPGGGTPTAFVLLDTMIYAGTENGQVFRSTNNGLSWSMENPNISSLGIRALTSSATQLFAGTGGIGVYSSVDNGVSWIPFNGGLTDMTVNALASSGGVLFAGTRTAGVFRSSVSGNWSLAFPAPNVRALVAIGSNVYAGTGNGVFRSSDNGTSWVATGFTSSSVYAIAVDDSVILVAAFGGVFRSTNLGASWTSTNLAGTIQALVFAGSSALAGSYGGEVYRSTDRGATWAQVTAFRSGPVNAFIISATGIIAGTTNSGIFRSTNNGISWSQANTGFANTSVTVAAVGGSTIVAASFEQGAFRSTDAGENWVESNTGLTATSVTSLAVSAENIFAGTYAGAGGGVFRSTDEGLTWTLVLYGNVWALGGGGSNLFAGTVGIKGDYYVYRSTDHGNTWTYTRLYARAFASIDSILFAGNYRSTDNGVSWMAMSFPVSPAIVRSYAVLGASLFAGTDGNGVFRSTDNGSTWVSANLSGTSIPGFVVIGSNLIAITTYSVFLSTNNGAAWTPVNPGLTNIGIGAITASSSNLFVGTGSTGVWRRPISEIIVGVEEESEREPPEAYSLDQNYPNPFNPSTKIRFAVPRSGFASLKVYDLLGREVARLVNEELKPGRYEVTLDASHLASGVYFYRVRAGEFVETKKLILLR